MSILEVVLFILGRWFLIFCSAMLIEMLLVRQGFVRKDSLFKIGLHGSMAFLFAFLSFGKNTDAFLGYLLAYAFMGPLSSSRSDLAQVMSKGRWWWKPGNKKDKKE